MTGATDGGAIRERMHAAFQPTICGMGNPVAIVTDTATQVVKAPIVAIRTRPLVWAIVFVVLALVILRYAATIHRTLSQAPVVGPYFYRFMAPRVPVATVAQS